MAKKSSSNAPSLHEGFDRQLLAYSVGAVVTVLAAPSAHAQVITNITDGLGGNLIFAGSDTATPTVHDTHANFTAGPFHGALLAQGGATWGSAFFSARNGDHIGYPIPLAGVVKNATFANSANFEIAYRSNGGGHHGGLLPPPLGAGAVATGYIGFKAGSDYGWLRVQVTDNGNGGAGNPAWITLVPKTGTDIYGAFVSGSDPLVADFQAGDISAIPEPAGIASGLGLLALGAAGVREMRRRRQMTSSSIT